MKRFFYIYFLVLLLLPIISFGFTLSVTTVNETCAGNGSATFNVTNPDPAGSIIYMVFRLPDTITPYASGTASFVNGLTAGDYRVIARETIGSTTTLQQRDFTITNSFVPLTYTVNSVNQACSTLSNVSITTDTGTAATYEIISGPATFPAQTSNTFTSLTVGLYRFKVTDDCGNSVVQAFTVAQNPNVLTTQAPNFTYTTPPSCTTVLATNTIVPASGTVIGYPVQVHYILHLPGGDTHINIVLNSGDPFSQDISQVIPYQTNSPYIYDVILTDGCGITHPANRFIANITISLSSTIIPLPCNENYFTLNAGNYMNSYTLQFTEMPATFNPTAFNSSYPGPFTQSSVVFGGTTNPVPFGDYKVTITDECGNTTVEEFSIVDKPPVPIIIGVSNGCFANDGKIILTMADYRIMTAIVTVAPASYPFPLPHNVTALISSDGSNLTLDPVPLGDYVLVITDDCNDIFPPLPVTVGPYVDQGMAISILHGCDRTISSVKIISEDTKPVSAKITLAPSSYPFPLPHDITQHIVSTGEIYLSDLPAGTYTFNIVDSCGFSADKTVALDGYSVTTNNFSIIPDCGTFNIALDFVSNLTSSEAFWLQKLLDPVTDTWGHPSTGIIYTAGALPNGTNSYSIQNNATTLNLTFTGVFRIVHQFQSYNNGADIKNRIVASPNKDCVEVITPNLTLIPLAINDVYLIPCSTTGSFDVFLSAVGAPPLRYQIVEKDGFPFVVDNGNSNVFLNLAPGIYKFEIEDSCGNSFNQVFDVSDLNSLVTIYPICNIVNCVSNITGNETFDLSSQAATILGIQSPNEYTISYYTSQSDADNDTNAITNITTFNPTSNPQTVYIRLIFNLFPNCFRTASFDLVTGQNPKINLAPEYIICDGSPVDLDASVGNLPGTTYQWSNGVTTPNLTVSNPGVTNLNITATNTYGNCNATDLTCTTAKDIIVKIAVIPAIESIDTRDWTDNENSITVTTSNQGDFLYSIDGISFQDTPIFDRLKPGLYTVFVRDVGGCVTVTQEVWLLNYPKFFTPNEDGYNETWYIRNSDKEPDFKVYIFDRYGKLITNIISNGPGWDGKLNGKTLFSDDYWFTAHRQDGRVHRGHFTLKR
ncbi:MAG: T9SS type B sorting domain-containing protein [Flavobacterium sp. JAD_PAG50586_2]|nr:MAG: T9SS type B sorting domain-containing protein [Flavobacterium sp. JAD_PAG50586_2]